MCDFGYYEAQIRVRNDAALLIHHDTIMFGDDSDEHWEWIATAPLLDIVEWALGEENDDGE